MLYEIIQVFLVPWAELLWELGPLLSLVLFGVGLRQVLKKLQQRKKPLEEKVLLLSEKLRQQLKSEELKLLGQLTQKKSLRRKMVSHISNSNLEKRDLSKSPQPVT